jgi:hypothetical protein
MLGGISFPPWVTFPRAPLRSRTVGFPESGSDLGLSSGGLPTEVEAQALARVHPSPPWFTLQPSPFFEARLPRLRVRDRPGTTECPEPLCTTETLPPSWKCPALPRWALPHLRRSYGLMRRTKTLPPPSALASGGWSLQVAASPCWEMALPDVISADSSLDAWACTPAARVVLIPAASHAASAFPTPFRWVGAHNFTT